MSWKALAWLLMGIICFLTINPTGTCLIISPIFSICQTITDYKIGLNNNKVIE